MFKRILVLRGGAIGDFVLTLPALKLLRAGFPSARLEILGYKHIVALAKNRFYADAARSIEYGALASFFAKGADLPSELADYFYSFDLVISYLFDPDRILEQNIARCGGETFLACNPRIAGGEHAAVQLARPLEQLGLSVASAAAQLHPTPDDQAFATSFLRDSAGPIIALHPGSGSTAKNWPTENWWQLGARLLEQDAPAASLLVVGGEADGVALSMLRTRWQDQRVRFAEDLPLPHLAAVLERCALFIGHDSGISHIAAAVGARCLLLFGATDPQVWAPANSNVRVVRAATHQLTDITVDEVAKAGHSILAELAGQTTN